MQLAAFEHLDSSSSAKSLLSCSSALSSLIARLERQLEGLPPRRDTPVLEPLSIVSVTWEKDLIAAAATHLLEAFHPEWVLVNLDDATNLLVRLHALAGRASAVRKLPESVRQSILEWVREATATARPIYVPDPRSDQRSAALAEIVPSTHSMFVVPLGGNKAEVEGAILLGFDAGQAEPSPTALEWLTQAASQIAASLFGNRQIEKRIAAAKKEFDRTAGAKLSRSSAACPLGTVVTVSLVPAANSGRVGDCDYCAIVTGPTGKVRLFVARLATQGVERTWETLAFDVAFRAACVLCKYPAEIVSMMNRVWVGASGDFGLVRHICCADVAESGREYVFAGSTTHLLYESPAQAVSELFERLPDEPESGGAWDGQHVRLHSGDVVILHTCDLPLSLPKRHEVFRRLAALLAREGRRPIADIASHVASLLCNGAAAGLPHPAVFVLRAE
jgi:hypothetical protein